MEKDIFKTSSDTISVSGFMPNSTSQNQLVS